MSAKPYTNGNGLETQRERVNALTRDVERLSANDNELFAKYESVGRTNWTIVLSAVTVATIIMGGLWGLTTTPISDDIKEIKRHLLSLNTLYVRKDVLDARRAEFAAKLSNLEEITKHSVVRQEYIERQRATELQMAIINGRVEEVRRDLGSIFPTTKVMDELLKRIDRLERVRIDQTVQKQ